MIRLLSLLVLFFCQLSWHSVKASLAVSWSYDGFLNAGEGCTSHHCWIRFTLRQVWSTAKRASAAVVSEYHLSNAAGREHVGGLLAGISGRFIVDQRTFKPIN
jgi:hypothetical protein